jgi:hypothetical protein
VAGPVGESAIHVLLCQATGDDGEQVRVAIAGDVETRVTTRTVGTPAITEVVANPTVSGARIDWEHNLTVRNRWKCGGCCGRRNPNSRLKFTVLTRASTSVKNAGSQCARNLASSDKACDRPKRARDHPTPREVVLPIAVRKVWGIVHLGFVKSQQADWRVQPTQRQYHYIGTPRSWHFDSI